MAWSKITHCDPHKVCVICGHVGNNLEVYEQTQGQGLLGKQHMQHCKKCGGAAMFYFDEYFNEYYCKIFKLVDDESNR